MKKIAIVIAAAAFLLTGCTSTAPATGTDPTSVTEEAISDAIGADVTPLLTSQLIGSWDTMTQAADQGCIASLTGSAVDPAVFDSAAAQYELAYDGLLADTGAALAGYPAAAPAVDSGDWCAVATVLKSARG